MCTSEKISPKQILGIHPILKYSFNYKRYFWVIMWKRKHNEKVLDSSYEDLRETYYIWVRPFKI